MNLNYKNVTISGGVAVGKNTLLETLKSKLVPVGFSFTSGGQLLRDFTKEYIQPTANLAPDEFHHQLDKRTINLLDKGYIVIEAWLAGFMARKRNDTLRVLLTCNNDALRIDRVVNRDKVSIEQAKTYIKEREESNFKEWRRIYGDFNFFSPDYYHLTIDTYSHGPQETAERVLKALGYEK